MPTKVVYAKRVTNEEIYKRLAARRAVLEDAESKLNDVNWFATRHDRSHRADCTYLRQDSRTLRLTDAEATEVIELVTYLRRGHLESLQQSFESYDVVVDILSDRPDEEKDEVSK